MCVCVCVWLLLLKQGAGYKKQQLAESRIVNSPLRSWFPYPPPHRQDLYNLISPSPATCSSKPGLHNPNLLFPVAFVAAPRFLESPASFSGQIAETNPCYHTFNAKMVQAPVRPGTLKPQFAWCQVPEHPRVERTRMAAR